MCLAVPLQVEKIVGGNKALVNQGGSELEVDVSLLEHVEVGNYVIVHAGYAIEVLDDDDADDRLALFQELGDAANAG